MICVITWLKKRDEKEIVNDKYEHNENEYYTFNDFLTPNHSILIKPRATILKWRYLRSQMNHFNKLILYN